MKEQPSNPCEKVSFILTYDQLEAAYCCGQAFL